MKNDLLNPWAFLVFVVILFFFLLSFFFIRNHYFLNNSSYPVLPADYILSCPKGIFISPEDDFSLFRLDDRLGSCFVYKYYDWAVVDPSDPDYDSQKEPFGEVCVYPADLRVKIKNGLLSQEDAKRSVACQPVLSRALDRR